MSRLKEFAAVIRMVLILGAGLALSGCLTTGGTGGASSTAAGAADTGNNVPAARTVNYAPSRAGMLEVEPLSFNPEDAPKVCVNDLRVFRAHLQMPGATNLDLNKPINTYIREAGGAHEALQAVYARINDLNVQLDLELARRNPFNAQSRRTSDDSIAALEDRILLNQALAEALECRR